MITVKSPEHIECMRIAGKVLAEVLELVSQAAQPGVTTKELDDLAYDFIVNKNKMVPSFKNYDGFPATMCISFDDEVVHGIPSTRRVLKEGMLVKLDCGVGYGGYHTDAARTVAVGKISPQKKHLMDVTKECFFEGIKVLKDGARLGTLGAAIQAHAEKNGLSVVKELIGHGIGTSVHEDPDVPNYGKVDRGLRVCKNMTLAIEPMLSLGRWEVWQKNDGWTYATIDGSPSAHYENTVVITDDGVEILTLA